jgi:endonuclease YncB( thermonuclease family)
MSSGRSKKTPKSKARTNFIVPIFFALLLSAFILSRAISPDLATGGSLLVKKVFDGDSVLLSDGREIRYIGIDAPETSGKRPEEYYGNEARGKNESLVLGKEVRLEYDVERKDIYGRTLAYVYLDDVMINLEMVKSGFALAVPYPPNLAHQDELCEAMLSARREKRGLWENPDAWMITTDEADRYIGLSKTVFGKVLHSDTVGVGTFLNFGDDFSQDFTAFIPADYHSLFYDHSILDPAGKYLGKVIEVTGTLKEKNGPSITVRHPCQIYIRQ